MVNRERLVNEFLELVGIDSLSHHEKEMAGVLKSKLGSMGFKPFEDEAGTKTSGDTGNVICNVNGTKKVPAILLMAHMDTVVPGRGKKPLVQGKMIRSDGTTVLGGDDAAGLVCILEALRIVKEQNIDHGDIQVVFSIAEEDGLYGSRYLDYSTIKAKYGFVFDGGGPIGTVAVNGPSQNKIDVVIIGKAAHAGTEPEKGISSIQIASEAVSQMKLGRIDEETTANIGIISGGRATNIICDRVELKGEARSRNPEKLKDQTEHMKECFEKAASKYGGTVELDIKLAYPSFSIKEDDPIMTILDRAANGAGIVLRPQATGGGSDTNIINGKGIQAVDLSVGMDKVHTVEEQISIEDIVKAADFLVEIIRQVE